MNIFRVLGDMSHLVARLLLVVKLHASRSAAGEDRIPVPQPCQTSCCGKNLKKFQINTKAARRSGEHLCMYVLVNCCVGESVYVVPLTAMGDSWVVVCFWMIITKSNQAFVSRLAPCTRRCCTFRHQSLPIVQQQQQQ